MNNEAEEENKRLRKELETAKKSEHEKSVILKLAAFFALAILAGYLATISPIGAIVISTGGFWFIFMR